MDTGWSSIDLQFRARRGREHLAIGRRRLRRRAADRESQCAASVRRVTRRTTPHFFEIAPKTGSDVMQMMLDGTRRVTPLLQSSFDERNGVVSPDGRWLAYEANDSGRFEISVRPFPAVNDGHWQISTSGGTRPVWARSGRELFYVSASGAIMQVGVEHGPSLATTPKLAIKDGYITTPGNPGRSYDVAADGQRFLMVKSDGGQDQTTAPASIIIVLNWVNELKRLAPAK